MLHKLQKKKAPYRYSSLYTYIRNKINATFNIATYYNYTATYICLDPTFFIIETISYFLFERSHFLIT